MTKGFKSSKSIASLKWKERKTFLEKYKMMRIGPSESWKLVREF